jgi:F0F1-type ATP synthase membrane subunit b/b'
LAFVGFAAAVPLKDQGEEYFFKDIYNDVKEKIKERIDDFNLREEEIKALGKEVADYSKELVEEEKDFVKNLYENAKAQLKERADEILAESKEKWSGLKTTLLTNKEVFLEDFETITNDLLDKITAPLDSVGEFNKVAASEVSGSLVEQLTKKLEGVTDILKGNFDTYYERIFEATAEGVNDVLILVNSQQLSLQEAVGAAVDDIVDTAVNGAEEFGLKDIREDVRDFAKESYKTAKAFVVNKYKKVKNFIKARVEVVVEETKEVWKGLKQTAKTHGEFFKEDLMDIMDEALDIVFAPIPKDENALVPEVEIERSLSEEISYQLSKRVDEMFDNFDIYYSRLIDAAAMAVESVKVAVNEMKVPLNEAVEDAVADVVDVTLNG